MQQIPNCEETLCLNTFSLPYYEKERYKENCVLDLKMQVCQQRSLHLNFICTYT